MPGQRGFEGGALDRNVVANFIAFRAVEEKEEIVVLDQQKKNDAPRAVPGSGVSLEQLRSRRKSRPFDGQQQGGLDGSPENLQGFGRQPATELAFEDAPADEETHGSVARSLLNPQRGNRVHRPLSGCIHRHRFPRDLARLESERN